MFSYHKFLASVVIIATALSCAKTKVADEAAVDITTDAMDFTRAGLCEGGIDVSTVNCNYDWVAYPTDPWITINPTSGTAGQDVQVKISVAENKKADTRSGAVNFFDSKMLSKRTCTVNQEGAYFYLNPAEKSFELLYDVTKVEFTINSNAKWTIKSSNPDYVPDATSGEGEKTIKVNFPANMGEDINNVEIIVSTDLDIEKNCDTVRISHKCFEYYVVVPESKNVTYFAKTVTIDIDANTSWTAKSLTEGATVTPTAGTTAGSVTVTFPNNGLNKSLEYKVEILADKTKIKQRGGVVTIKQDAAEWTPFGKAWGSTFNVSMVEYAKTKAINTCEGITFSAWPSDSFTSGYIKGNTTFFFYAKEAGHAKMFFDRIETAKTSGAISSKQIQIAVNGVVRGTLYTAQTLLENQTVDIGMVAPGDTIEFSSRGSGSYNRIYTGKTSGNFFSFLKVTE